MQTAITRARTYLEARLNETLDDPYALALMTYALQISGSSLTDEALAALNAHAVIEGEQSHAHCINFDFRDLSLSSRTLLVSTHFINCVAFCTSLCLFQSLQICWYLMLLYIL